MFKFWPVLAISAVLMILPFHAQAAAENADAVLNHLAQPIGLSAQPAPSEEDNTIRLVSNKDTLLRLDQDAASVIVNNPSNLSVMLDSPRLLILMPRQPGATSFMVLDAKGEMILQKDIIVSNVSSKYVRIRKMCDGASNCLPTSYYYCPDGCYEVNPVAPDSGGSIPPPPATAAKEALDASTALAPARNDATAPPAAGAP